MRFVLLGIGTGGYVLYYSEVMMSKITIAENFKGLQYGVMH